MVLGFLEHERHSILNLGSQPEPVQRSGPSELAEIFQEALHTMLKT